MTAAVGPVRFEHQDPSEAALGVGTATPRLSWQVTTDDPQWRQTAYEVERDGADRVRVPGAEQVLVDWPFEPLPSRTRAAVRVRVACGEQWSGWSTPAEVETGLLRPADWAARFVSPRTLGEIGSPAPIVSRAFRLRPGAVRGRLYTTALGVHDLTLNGTRVGDEVLAPGWTSYHRRLRYRTHDVTALLRAGENTLEALLGNGWYRGRLGWTGRRAHYGDRLALLAQLEVAYADGTAEVVSTDRQWTARDSGVLADDLYDGQRTDLRPADPRTCPVDVLAQDLGVLVAPDGPPVRVTEVVPAVSVVRSPSGRTVVDFGQNLVGWVRLRVRGARTGQEVAVRHAEVLQDGELATRPLRSARAADSYLLDGSSPEEGAVLEPSLTFHGYRYAEVTGVEGLRAQDVEAVVVGTGLRRTGWFDCSEPLLDRFHQNVVWSMRGNFLDVPTDCPQRDERLGWTGDIQVFSPTAGFLFDTAGFLTSWLADLAADQLPDGSVPFVIPDIFGKPGPAAAAWGDAAVVVPWVVYQRHGDRGLLERQLPSMGRWVEKAAALTTDGVWAGGFQYGDWLDPAAPPENPFAARTPPDVVATAHLARSAGITAEAARLLGRPQESQRYAALAERTRAAFARCYATPAGRVLGDAPTGYAMALAWDLLPTAEQRDGAARRLADLVRTAGFRIGTGFVGTPLIADALTGCGRADLARRLLLERGCPSWLYPVTMGATTVWERWDSLLPDGTVNPGEMTSFNHYALGAVADWMHRAVAGLAPAAPGYREITVRPLPGPELTSASARHLTPYGPASVSWRRGGGEFTLEAEVPAGSRAVVHLPGRAEPVGVGHGHHSWTVPDPVAAAPDHPVRTVRELLDAPRLWEAAARVLTGHHLAADTADLARRAAPYLDFPARDLPDLLTGGDLDHRGQRARDELAAVLDGG